MSPSLDERTEPVEIGDPIPPNAVLVEVRVSELRQLFNAIDPSPFRDRDLDPSAEAFIVDWVRETPRDAPVALLVHLEHSSGHPEEFVGLGGAVRQYFAARSRGTRGRLRRLFAVGRVSLLIGLVVLVTLSLTAQLITRQAGVNGVTDFLHESLLIGGWVAMWRPLEIFLYDWWPIRAEARLFDRLALMPVRVRCHGGSPSPFRTK